MTVLTILHAACGTTTFFGENWILQDLVFLAFIVQINVFAIET